MTISCTNCQSELAVETRFCPQCGTPAPAGSTDDVVPPADNVADNDTAAGDDTTDGSETAAGLATDNETDTADDNDDTPVAHGVAAPDTPAATPPDAMWARGTDAAHEAATEPAVSPEPPAVSPESPASPSSWDASMAPPPAHAVAPPDEFASDPATPSEPTAPAWSAQSGSEHGAPPDPSTKWHADGSVPAGVAGPGAVVAGPPVAGSPVAGSPPGASPTFGSDDAPVMEPHPVEPVEVSDGASNPGKLAAIGLGVVGLLAVGFIALRFITGGDDVAGGTSSPEAVVAEMVEAINAQDPLAVVALMAPDEIDGFDDLVQDLNDLYSDLGFDEIVEEQIDEASESGFDLVIELDADRIDVSMEGERAAIVAFELSGDVELVGDEDSAVGDLIGEQEFSFDDRDLEGALPNGSDEVEMIVVEIDGKWFMSPMLTIGHYIVENNGMPRGEYDRIGEDRGENAESAEEVVQSLVDVINDPDVDDLASVLGGGEGRVAVAFRDALDDGFDGLDSGEARYELSVETTDIGNGRVELSEIELALTDEFSSGTIRIADGCAIVREDGGSTERECIVDALGVDDEDLDTSIWLDTVEEDGVRRVRIIPTITDVARRFLGLYDDRQALLFASDQAYLDTATEVSVGSDIEIDFAGSLYVVNEFPVEEGEWYNVTAQNDAEVGVWADQGFGLEQVFGLFFRAEEDGMARVVTYSEVDFDEECGIFGCLPSGEGSTTLRIRQAVRQSVPFPTILSGELGPGDARLFEFEVTQRETVFIEVDGATVDRFFVDDFDVYVEFDTYDLAPGTYEFLVSNFDGDESTTYTITPTAV